MLLTSVRKYIESEIGLATGSHVLVAVSGGADSTALLLIMHLLHWRVTALHCNFHLRGEESDRDQAFVEQLCDSLNIPLHVNHFSTHDVARRRGISVEMAARDLRYEWFRQQMHELQADCVAVAHHRTDQAETLLLNLLRGTGLRGMAGMQPRHDGIIRPLLGVSRQQLLQFLHDRGQAYVTDSTNALRVAKRNALRLDVIPILEQISPAAVAHLCRACDNVRRSLPFYEEGIRVAAARCGVSASSFPLSAVQQDALLHEWLGGKGFNRAQEESMRTACYKAVGRVWKSSTHSVVRDRTALCLVPHAEEEGMPVLKSEEVDAIGETGGHIAYFDADLLSGPVCVRRVQRGDAFVPFGMKGRKLVSDFLTDSKVNVAQKQRQFVAVCGEDIVWLIGHRSDNRYRVTSATRRILKLTAISV